MSELFNNSSLLLIAQVIALGVFIKLVVFPLIENLSLNTKEKKVEATIPLDEIFVDYNHTNPEAWYAWISKQKSSKQSQAFQKLVQYLDISPELFKPVLNDVIRIITAFKKPGTETAIFKLLKRISAPNPPKEYYDYYAKALKSLIELNAERAANFLDEEYQRHHKNPEYVKRFVYASSFFPSNRLPIKLLTNYLLNVDYLINERIRLLESMKDKPENFYEVSIAVLERLLDNKDTDPMITEYCYIKLLELKKIEQKNLKKALKTLFNNTWVSDHLFAILKNHLIQNPSSKVNSLSLASIVSSVNPINYDSLKELLYERYNISEEESILIDQTDEINKFEEGSKLELTKAINIFDSHQEKLPEFLENKYETFKDYCFNDKYNSFKFIYGTNLKEQYLLIKKMANEENKKILVLSIEKLASDQTLLDNLETHLKTILNKVLYIPGFEVILKELTKDEDSNNVYRKILNRFKFLTLKSNIPIIVSCNKTSLDTKAIELLKNEKEIPKQEYELTSFNQEERHNIIAKYLSILSPERKEEKTIALDLYSKTKEFSSLNFTSYILNYIKLSLLSQGKLFKEEEYQTILDSEEKQETVSIKDLVAKVNIQD